MPTPNDSSTQLTFGADLHLERLTHTTCPPDSERSGTWRNGHEEGPDPEDVMDGALPPRQQDCAATEIEATGSMEDINHNHQPSPTPTNHKSDRNTNNMDEEHSSADGSSPMSTTTEIKDSDQLPSPAPMADTVELSSSLSSRFGIPNVRVCRDLSSRFRILYGYGTQAYNANLRPADDPHAYLVISPQRQQIPRHPAVRQTTI